MRPRIRFLSCGGAVVGTGGRKARLTPSEALMLTAVMARSFVPRDEMVEILWPNPNRQPDFWDTAMKVHAHNIRRKLKPFGVAVRSRIGFGYFLELNGEFA